MKQFSLNSNASLLAILLMGILGLGPMSFPVFATPLASITFSPSAVGDGSYSPPATPGAELGWTGGTAGGISSSNVQTQPAPSSQTLKYFHMTNNGVSFVTSGVDVNALKGASLVADIKFAFYSTSSSGLDAVDALTSRLEIAQDGNFTNTAGGNLITTVIQDVPVGMAPAWGDSVFAAVPHINLAFSGFPTEDFIFHPFSVTAVVPAAASNPHARIVVQSIAGISISEHILFDDIVFSTSDVIGVSIEPVVASITEGGNLRVRVVRSGDATAGVTGSISLQGLSGLNPSGADFTSGASVPFSIAAGATSVEVTIPTVDDTLAEGPETFTATLSALNGAGPLAPLSTVLTIVDNEPQISLVPVVDSVTEGAPLSVRIERTGTATTEVTGLVTFTGVTGRSLDRLDFVNPNGVPFTLAAGATSLVVSIPTVDDTIYDGIETYSATVTGLTGAILVAPSSTVLTLLDNDALPPESTFVVTSTAATGPGSLRQAMLDANAHAGLDIVTFNIPNVFPVITVALDTNTTVSDLVIDGTTQPPLADGSPVLINIEEFAASGPAQITLLNNVHLHGLGLAAKTFEAVHISGAGNLITRCRFTRTPVATWGGLSLGSGSSNNRVGGSETNKNTFSDHFFTAITLAGSGNLIQGNDFLAGSGIRVNSSGAVPNRIEGIPGAENTFTSVSKPIEATSASGVIIRGNDFTGSSPAITLTSCTGSIVENNRITIPEFSVSGINIVSPQSGVTIRGNTVFSSGLTGTIRGIQISAQNSTGLVDIGGNHLYGLPGAGIWIENTGSTAVTWRIHGNTIGLNTRYASPVEPFSGWPANVFPSSRGMGIVLRGPMVNMTIGGEANAITGHLGPNVIAGNTVGVVHFGPFVNIPNGVRMGRNILGANGAGPFVGSASDFDLATATDVELANGTAVIGQTTLNDALDADTGPNGYQNFPVLSAVTNTAITGTLGSKASGTYTICLYAGLGACGAGATAVLDGPLMQIGEISTTTDAAGNASFSFPLSSPLPYWTVVKALATDAQGNSSEFSAPICREGPQVSIRSVGASVTEGSTLSVRVDRTGDSTPEVTGRVTFTGLAGTSLDRLDFVNPDGVPFTIPAGENTILISIPTVDDTLPETTETYTATIISLVAARLVAPTSTVLTILDNEPEISLQAVTGSVTEGGNLSVRVQRIGNSAPAITGTLSFTGVSGLSLDRLDFVNPDGVPFTMPAGADFIVVTIPTVDDALIEDTETYSATITSLAGARLVEPTSTVLTILDNEPEVSLQSVIASVTEGGNLSVRVQRIGSSAPAITGTLSFTGINGLSLDRLDFVNPDGVPFTVPAGVEFIVVTIPTVDDALFESVETYSATITNLLGAGLREPSSSVLTILDNEPFPAESTFVVTTKATSGVGSFRQALLDTNAHAGLDLIKFNIPNPTASALTITMTTSVEVSDLVIDGTTQPALPNGSPTLVNVQCLNDQTGAPLVLGNNVRLHGLGFSSSTFSPVGISGSGNTVTRCRFFPYLTSRYGGIDLYGSSSDNVVGGAGVDKNTFLGAFTHHISLQGAGNLVQGNDFDGGPGQIFWDPVGIEIGNSWGPPNRVEGIPGAENAFTRISKGISGRFISGAVIRGNDFDNRDRPLAYEGVISLEFVSSVWIENNRLNLHANSTIGILIRQPQGDLKIMGNTIFGSGNASGIAINAAQGTGFMDIGGNHLHSLTNGGIVLTNSGNSSVTWRVHGNTIGLSSQLTVPVAPYSAWPAGVFPETRGIGIKLYGAIENLTIGGELDASTGHLGPNVIAGNYVGIVATESSSRVSTAVRFGRNLIGANPPHGAYGPAQDFDLADASGALGLTTPNDSFDDDYGPNGFQNFPVLAPITDTAISGTLNSQAAETYIISIYAGRGACGVGTTATADGPMVQIGEIIVTTDGAGNASFTLPQTTPLPPSTVVKAIATDALGNSSEFSAPVCKDGPGVSLTALLASVTEGGTFTVRIDRTGDPAVAISGIVSLSSSLGSARLTNPNGVPFSLPVGTNTLVVSLPTLDDASREEVATFTASLAALSDGVHTSVPYSAVLTLLDNDGPRISIGDVTVTEGSGGGDTVINLPITVTGQLPPSGSFRGFLSIAAPAAPGMTATPDVDYGPAGPVPFYVESLGTTNYQMTIVNDNIYEGTETFQVTVTADTSVFNFNPNEFIIERGTATVTILDDELPLLRPIVPTNVLEGDTGTTPVTMRVLLSGPYETEARVNWTTAATLPSGLVHGFASPGSDYIAVSGTLIFPPGVTEQTLTVQVIGDRKREPAPGGLELFDILFTNPVNMSLAGTTTQRSPIAIIDNDQRTLTAPSQSVTEGNTGLKAVTFTVTMNDTAGPAALDEAYAFSWTTPDAATDLVTATGTVSIPAGQTTGTFVVQVRGDRLYEANEVFEIQIFPAPELDPVVPVTTHLTIINDDAIPSLSIANTIVTRGTTEEVDYYAWFRITLSTASGAPVTVQITTLDGTATAPDDYTSINSTLVIPAGERTKWVAVPVWPDETLNETFQLKITGVSGATLSSTGIATASVTQLRIIDFFPSLAPHVYIVSYPTGLGQGYVLEESSDLESDWHPVTGIIQGSGAIINEVRYCTGEKCFYRVRAVASPPTQ